MSLTIFRVGNLDKSQELPELGVVLQADEPRDLQLLVRRLPHEIVEVVRKIAIDPEHLGRVVREAWMVWAREQPDVVEHPSWLIPWDELAERDREVDRRIGAAVARAVAAVK